MPDNDRAELMTFHEQEMRMRCIEAAATAVGRTSMMTIAEPGYSESYSLTPIQIPHGPATGFMVTAMAGELLAWVMKQPQPKE